MRLLPRVTFAAILFGALLVPTHAQDNVKPTKTGGTLALMRLLELEIETKNFQEPIKLKQALEYLYERTGGKLVVLADMRAFEAVNAAATPPNPMMAGPPEIYDEEVSLPPLPTKMTTGLALRLIVAQLANGKATFAFRQGHVLIIPEQYNRPAYFFKQPVLDSYDKRPLDEILSTFSEASGLTINIDPRVGDKAFAPISATFRNTPLEDALVVVTEAADLKFVVMSNSVLVTTPAHAAAIVKEQKERQATLKEK